MGSVPQGAGCRPAGLAAAEPAGGALPPVEASVAAGVPPLAPLPPLQQTSFCADPMGGDAVFCPAAACAGDRSDGACRPVGVPWSSGLCPPGFLPDAAAARDPADLPACIPDPADCGPAGDPWGDPALQDGPGVLFVDGVHGQDAAQGTRAAPLATIGAAIAKIAPGGTIAIAKGKYQEALLLLEAVTLRGRCAAMVELAAPTGKVALRVNRPPASAGVAVRNLAVTGPGNGIDIQSGKAILDRVWLHGAGTAGLVATSPGSEVVVTSGVIADGSPGLADMGVGVLANGGARLHLQDVRLSRNHVVGLGISSSAEVSAVALLVDGTRPRQSDGELGRAIQVQGGGRLDLASGRLTGNRDVALFAGGKGSTVTARRLLVDGTLPQAKDGTGGFGVSVQSGGQATLVEVRLSGNHHVGLYTSGATSRVQARALLVDGTRPTGGQFGRGIEIVLGARLELHTARCSGNRELGLFASSGAQVTATALLVDGTLPREADQIRGWGASVEKGSVVDLTGARLTGNREVGMLVTGQGTHAVLRGLVVDHTLSRASDGLFGRGLEVTAGGRVQWLGGRLSANRDVGLAVNATGTEAQVAGLLVDGTAVNGAGHALAGVLTRNGARLELTGAWLQGNAGAGLFAYGHSQVRLVGVQVTGSVANGQGVFGNGLLFDVLSQDAEVVACRVAGCRAAAVLAYQARLGIQGTVLAETWGAELPRVEERGEIGEDLVSLADGLVALSKSQLVVADSLIADNPRAGVLLKAGAVAMLTRTAITGGHFGLAVDGDPAPQLQAVAVHGSGRSLAGAAGLTAPPPPEPVQVDLQPVSDP